MGVVALCKFGTITGFGLITFGGRAPKAKITVFDILRSFVYCYFLSTSQVHRDRGAVGPQNIWKKLPSQILRKWGKPILRVWHFFQIPYCRNWGIAPWGPLGAAKNGVGIGSISTSGPELLRFVFWGLGTFTFGGPEICSGVV